MSIYLFQNERQTGPFTDDQVRQMLSTAIISGNTLGWKEGMAGWEPVSSFVVSTARENPSAPPPRRNSALGLTSFIISLVSVPIWFVLITVAGVAHNSGAITPAVNMIIGMFVIAGLFVNLAALIVGLVAAFKSRPNTLAILGVCFNALIVVGLIGLVCLGLAMKHQTGS